MENKNNLVKDHLYKKFYEGLYEKYNITKEQFNEYNFIKRAGSNKNGKLSKDTYLRNSPIELLELIPRMKRVNECVCKVKILYNCFIYSETQDIMLVIGSCCNKNYTKNKNKRFCSKCGVEHKNRVDNICNDCRKEENQLIIKKCKKCKEPKNYDKYPYCIECGTSGKLYNKCSECKNNKKEDSYTRCFSCNMQLKKIKTKNIII
jgi:hypothetical protein